jgi:DNA-binding HxlR family transcriptional regulator
MKLGNKMKSQPSSVKTIADMLKGLNSNNLIKREAFNEIPPIVDYTLIEDCEKFREVLACFLDTKEKV